MEALTGIVFQQSSEPFIRVTPWTSLLSRANRMIWRHPDLKKI